MLSFDPGDARYLRELAEFVVVPTAGHPVVLGEWLGAPGAPTVLVYGHYDVQPTGDLAEWDSPPFELTADGAVVRGRGATDDKGPVYIVLKTAQAYLEQEGGLPLNVKFLFEGEEEIGSPNLPAFLAEHADELAADLVVSADGAMWRPTEPSVALASKGLVTIDITVHGANTDLHSGRYGGTVANTLHVLSEILASLHRPDGTVAVDGFYDGIPPLTAERRRQLAAIDFSETEYLAGLGLPQPHGEAGYSTIERLWERPTLDVNGVRGGGKYTVIPHVAVGHVSCRLVPGQDPDAVIEAIAAHVRGPGDGGNAGHRARRPGAGPRLYDPRRPPGHRRCRRRAGGRLPRSGGPAGVRAGDAARNGSLRAAARRQDPVLLLLHRGREAARAQRVPAHPPAARGHAGVGAAVAAARRRPAPAAGRSRWRPHLNLAVRPTPTAPAGRS